MKKSDKDLGGGKINTGRAYDANPAGPLRVGRFLAADLVTHAKHEIGHALGFLRSPAGVRDAAWHNDTDLTAGFEGDDAEAASLLRRLVQNDIPVSDFHLEHDDIEDIF